MWKAASLIALILAGSSPAKAQKTTEPHSFGAQYFKNMQACFLLYNMKTKAYEKVFGEETCREQFTAFSTFKIPLAAIAFDSGALQDENVVLKWDGTPNFLPQFNRDHSAKTWMKESVVWFSQRLTPQVGQSRLQKYLEAFHYGNRDLTAGISTAWLVAPWKHTSSLKISAYEQIEFLEKLWSGTLPVSRRAIELTQKITYIEMSPHGAILSGKTGSSFEDPARTKNFGWFISHISVGENEYLTAMNIRYPRPSAEKEYGGKKAARITKQILSDIGLL